jgi:hypothetical protein
MHTIQHLLSQIGDGSWQDVMLSAGNIFFCVTRIPMLRQPERPPLLTCVPTGLALIAGGFVFATLHLWLTALTQTIAGLQWLALVFKRSPRAASRDRVRYPVSGSRSHLRPPTWHPMDEWRLFLVELFCHDNRLCQVKDNAFVAGGKAKVDAMRFQQSLDVT